MTFGLREPLRVTACCLVTLVGFAAAQAAPVSPAWNMRQPPQPDMSLMDRGGLQPDPVLPVIESIGQPIETPRLDPGGLRIAQAARLSGGDGANETLFAGGVASSGGNTRLIEGVSEARDPVQLLPPEPTVAVRISAPAGHAVLAALAALLALRNRARIGRVLRG